MRKARLLRTMAILACILAVSAFSVSSFGQGCVAAHTDQPLVIGLHPTTQEQLSHHSDGLEGWLHN
ncbi:MAG TPA: hypothetical protein VJ453_09665 [Terriglobales bacterium]|nr:hypothetical protein [Terriglobales bacterium]